MPEIPQNRLEQKLYTITHRPTFMFALFSKHIYYGARWDYYCAISIMESRITSHIFHILRHFQNGADFTCFVYHAIFAFKWGFN